MQRSKLKNIINKSKEISNKPVGDPYDLFKSSLPEELEYYKGNNYRLKAAWKAYGSPKDYKEAIWNGLILPIDENTYKMPSIGYNEETDSYEYLNKGKENDIVAKDIRVWDNDVIPFVLELKHGGYVRTFNEIEDCWTYSKNTQEKTSLGLDDSSFQLETGGELIDSFLKGGKPKRVKNDSTYSEFIATLPSNLLKGNDGEYGYRMRYAFDNSPDVWTFNDAKNKFIFWNDEDKSWHGSTIFEPTGEFLKSSKHPTLHYELDWYNSNNPEAVEFRKNYKLETTDNLGNPLKYYRYIKRDPLAFKLGGQMSVIPEGALHARKNNMEGAGDKFTAKGIPVMDNGGEQQAEIERNEIIYSKSATETIEKAYNEYSKEDTTESRKDELAIKIGKFLTKEILENTQDNTGLIEEVAEKNNLKYNK